MENVPAHDSQMDNCEEATTACQTMTSANQSSGSTTTEGIQKAFAQLNH